MELPRPRGLAPAVTVALGLALLAAGCARRAALPETPLVTCPAPSGSALFDPHVPLGLDCAVRTALIRNPSLRAEAEEVAAAAANLRAVAGARHPSASLNASANRHLDPQRVAQPTSPGDPVSYARTLAVADLLVTLPLDVSGRLGFLTDAAEARLLERRLLHERSRQALAFEVRRAFVEILRARSLVASLDQSREALEGHLARVDNLVAQQKAARVDRLRTEVRLADLRQRTVLARNVADVNLRTLATLLDAAGTPVETAGSLDEPSTPLPPLSDLLTLAAGRRPDLAAAAAAERAARLDRSAVRAGLDPALALHADLGYRRAMASSAGGEDGRDTGYVGVAVTLPVFDRTSLRARVSEAGHRQAALTSRRRDRSQRVALEVETAYLEVGASRERIAATGTSVTQAAESLRIEREKYALGKGTTIDVLDAQSALIEAQTNLYQATAALNVALAGLDLATGKALP